MPKGFLEIELQGNIRQQTKALQDTLLNTLGWKGVRRLEQFALVTAARSVQDEVRAETPGGRNGRLGKAVRGRKSRLQYPGAIVGPVGGKKGAWFGWFVVKGTKPHMIPDDTVGRRLNILVGGKVVQRVKHPGARANNFVTPTVEKNIQQVQDAIGATIVMLIRDEAKRNKVLGLQEAYAGKSAAGWQTKSWAIDYKNPDKMEKVNIGSNPRARSGARPSGTMSPIPQVSRRS